MKPAILFKDGDKYRISVKGQNIFFSKSKSWVVSNFEQKFLQTNFAKDNGYTYVPDLIDETEEAAVSKLDVKVSSVPINTRFQFLESLVDMVLSDVCHSMIVTGEGGLGKTYTVRQCLDSKCSEDAGDYKWISGYISAKSLFRVLHDYRDKTIVFDDCDSVFKDFEGLNLLKSALDDKKTRKVSWLTERVSSDLESEFDFEGRIIFISNIPMEKFSQAIKSRSMMVDLNMTFADKIERMQHIISAMSQEANEEERDDSLRFAIAHGERMNDFNFRTLEKIIKIRRGAGDKWEEMAKYMTGVKE